MYTVGYIRIRTSEHTFFFRSVMVKYHYHYSNIFIVHYVIIQNRDDYLENPTVFYTVFYTGFTSGF